jgi:hypothetical protein
VFFSGPIWDRANRVTQACRLKRIVPKHDRRIGRIGDWTDHLCPCPSILRWALLQRARRTVCRRWQDRSVASDNRDPVAESPPVGKRRRTLVVLICCCWGALRLGCPHHGLGRQKRPWKRNRVEASRGCRGRQCAPLLARTTRAKSAAGRAAEADRSQSHPPVACNAHRPSFISMRYNMLIVVYQPFACPAGAARPTGNQLLDRPDLAASLSLPSIRPTR